MGRPGLILALEGLHPNQIPYVALQIDRRLRELVLLPIPIIDDHPPRGDQQQLDRECGSFPGSLFSNSAFLYLPFDVSSGVCLRQGASTKYDCHL